MNSNSEGRKTPRDSSFCDPRPREEFDLDVLLRALAHSCRREVLCLLDAEPEWTYGDLAESLDTVEGNPGTASGAEPESMLYHQHLPMLAEAGLIEGDETFRRIRRGEHFDDCRTMVDAAVAALP